MSSTTTPNLLIPLVEGSDLVSKDSINNASEAIDKNALPVSHKEAKMHWTMWQAGVAYKKQDVFRTSNIPSWGFWEVTTAGTSGNTEPTGSGEGDIFADGTCQLILRRLTLADGGIGSVERVDDTLVFTDSKNRKQTVSINDISHATSADSATKADKATKADSATKATQDKNGTPITNYIISAAASSKVNTITFTQGDGTTTDIAISGSSGGGIKSVERKDDTLQFTNSDSTTLSVSINDISHATKADEATNDTNGVALTSYIKGVEANSDGTELTITKGDGSSTKLTIGSSTYVDTTEPWSADVSQYTANKSLVTYDQSLYLCIVTHKPTNFEKDLNNGYWKQIDSDQTVIGSASGYSQIVKKNITAPKTLTIAINDTPSLCLPPVECLKSGTQETNIDVKANAYDSSEEASFTFDSGVEFADSGVSLKTSYSVDMTIPVALGDSGYISESDYIDFDEYKSVEGVVNV